MKFKNQIIIDKNSFDWIKTSAKLISKVEAKRPEDPKYATNIPGEIGLQLTYRCNLRCPHCFQWNEHGFFHHFENTKDLDFSIVEKVINETLSENSRLYLWGGEPLVYNYWENLIDILIKNPRQSVICTNGILLHKRAASLLKLPLAPNLLISLDGLEADHEIMRGKGTFHKVSDNIKLLIEAKHKGLYHGHISINCVLNNFNIKNLYEFASYCEDLKVDTLYFCFPWYISPDTAKKMDKYVMNFLPNSCIKDIQFAPNSWHSYDFHIDLKYYDDLLKQIDQLNSKIWKINLRFNPNLHPTEIKDFILGNDKAVQNKSKCLAISNRIDILADGSVSACKHFPEFRMGNYKGKSISEIWLNSNFNEFRKILNSNLMPVCSKCILLYQSGR